MNQDTTNQNIAVTFSETPNPQSMKFSINQTVSETTHDYKSSLEAGNSPLASKIFGFPWTENIFVGNDHITITKQSWVEWDVLAEPLSNLIKEHIESGEAVVTDTLDNNDDSNLSNAVSADDSSAVQKIKTVINNEIRPAVALDGGDVVFSRYENNIVYVYMQGACSGCPSASETLKHGIEARLKTALPEITEVVSL